MADPRFPMPMKRCYVVRHAQTAWNGENRLQGRSDLPLSPLGQRQAECLGQVFASRHLRGIVTSDLQRSQQTAHAIASGNGHGVSPLVEPELAEMHLGAWEGLTPEEIDARFDGAYRQWKTRPSTVIIPGAEPHEAFRARVRRAFEKVVARFEDGEYVVVSHGGVIAAMLADVLQADYDALLRRLQLDNASVTALECGTGFARVLWINGTAHLQPLAPDATPSGWL